MHSTKSPSLVGYVMVLVLFAFAVPAAAQEQSDFPHDENRNPYEAGQTLDSHGNIIRERETQRDSTLAKPFVTVKPKSVEAASKPKNQEEPLSFNFLYYIIQRFKGADVVD